MIKKIIKFPNPSLRRECAWVKLPLSQEILDHIQDLKDTLAATPNGIALASNQIIENGYRIFVTRPGTGLPEVVTNPRWRLVPDESTVVRINEGCLSIPELNTMAARQSHIYFTWGDITLDSETVAVKFTGLEAQIIQHECEHLNGGSLTDHISNKDYIKLRAEAIKNRKAGK